MNYTRNIAKKLILLCSISTLGFSAPDPVTLPIQTPKTPSAPTHTQAKKNFGFFFGGGIGGGIEKTSFQPINSSAISDRAIFPTGTLSVLLGAYQYFNPWFGLRYYYDLDVSLGSYPHTGDRLGRPGNLDYFLASYRNTLNLDAVFDVYKGSTFDLGLIVGVGAGFFIGQANLKYRGFYHVHPYLDNSVNFTTKINAGMRFLIDAKYSIELMAKIYPNTHLVRDDTQNRNNGFIKGKVFSNGLYGFTMNFVMEM